MHRDRRSAVEAESLLLSHWEAIEGVVAALRLRAVNAEAERDEARAERDAWLRDRNTWSNLARRRRGECNAETARADEAEARAEAQWNEAIEAVVSHLHGMWTFDSIRSLKRPEGVTGDSVAASKIDEALRAAPASTESGPVTYFGEVHDRARARAEAARGASSASASDGDDPNATPSSQVPAACSHPTVTHHSVPCPDGKPGCAVYHVKSVCAVCGDVPFAATRTEQAESPQASEAPRREPEAEEPPCNLLCNYSGNRNPLQHNDFCPKRIAADPVAASERILDERANRTSPAEIRDQALAEAEARFTKFRELAARDADHAEDHGHDSSGSRREAAAFGLATSEISALRQQPPVSWVRADEADKRVAAEKAEIAMLSARITTAERMYQELKARYEAQVRATAELNDRLRAESALADQRVTEAVAKERAEGVLAGLQMAEDALHERATNANNPIAKHWLCTAAQHTIAPLRTRLEEARSTATAGEGGGQ